jgi:hypothetical protein
MSDTPDERPQEGQGLSRRELLRRAGVGAAAIGVGGAAAPTGPAGRVSRTRAASARTSDRTARFYGSDSNKWMAFRSAQTYL